MKWPSLPTRHTLYKTGAMLGIRQRCLEQREVPHHNVSQISLFFINILTFCLKVSEYLFICPLFWFINYGSISPILSFDYWFWHCDIVGWFFFFFLLCILTIHFPCDPEFARALWCRWIYWLSACWLVFTLAVMHLQPSPPVPGKGHPPRILPNIILH